MDHLTVVGHSKGGNMAASMAYLLPEGMVDKVYSIDGQGESKLFLDNIPGERQEYPRESVFNINEYRDRGRSFVPFRLARKLSKLNLSASKRTGYLDSLEITEAYSGNQAETDVCETVNGCVLRQSVDWRCRMGEDHL